jgi:hypothetical protein
LGTPGDPFPSPTFDDSDTEAWYGYGQSYYQPGPDVIGRVYLMVWCQRVYEDTDKTRLVGRRYRYRVSLVAFDPYSSVGGDYIWLNGPIHDGWLENTRCVSKVFSSEPPLQAQIFEADSFDIPVPPIEDWSVPNPNPPDTPPDADYPYYAYPPGGTVTVGPFHFYNPSGDGSCGNITDAPPDLPDDPWWVVFNTPLTPSVVQQFDPPVNWTGGPYTTESIATYYKEQLTGSYYCVQWHDHEGDVNDPPVVTEDSVPKMVGPVWVDCITKAEFDSVTSGPDVVSVVVGGRTYYYNCPPRFPEPRDPDLTYPPEETPPRLRRGTIIDGPWHEDLVDYPTTDNCPDQSPGVNLCPPDGDHPDPWPRFVIPPDTDPILWLGFEGVRKTGLEKCRENCPMCSRLRKCAILTADGFVLVDEPADRGTDWRADLPADLMSSNATVGDIMYWSGAFCEWICSNPCNQQTFPEFCGDSSIFPGTFYGCADRERPMMSVLSPQTTFTGPAPELTRRDVKVMRASMGESSKSAAPVRLSAKVESASTTLLPCDHRKDKTGSWKVCKTCGNSVMLPVYGCGIHGQCLVNAVEGGIKSCSTCPDRAVNGVPVPAPHDPIAVTKSAEIDKKRVKLYEMEGRGRCAYVGDLFEKAVGCDGGPKCTFECDHPNAEKRDTHPRCIPLDKFIPTKKGGCPHWSNHVEPSEVG